MRFFSKKKKYTSVHKHERSQLLNERFEHRGIIFILASV